MEIEQIIAFLVITAFWVYSIYKINTSQKNNELFEPVMVNTIVFAILMGIVILLTVDFKHHMDNCDKDCPKLERVENVYRIKQ